MKKVFDGLAAGLVIACATAALPAAASTDYAPAIWNPAASCNYSARTTSISHVAIHTTQGSYAGTISWFQNCASSVSAHYVIRSSDGQVTQMVREADKAWHVGNSNGYTVGIEHEGYVANPSVWYTTAMYNASAALTRDILASRGLPQKVYDGSSGWSAKVADSLYDVKGHVNYANQTHTDPGSGWDWPRYKSLVAGGTSGGGGGGTAMTWPLVQYGASGERVRTIQYLLQQWGYSLTVDGSFGTGTQTAVKNFQSSHGLTADGAVGNATWPALTIVTQQGDSGSKVRAVQSQLRESGYTTVTVDGVFGPATNTAVRSFQSSKGLGVDGIVGDNTWNKFAW